MEALMVINTVADHFSLITSGVIDLDLEDSVVTV